MSILNWLRWRERPHQCESGTDLCVKQAIELAVVGIDSRLGLVKDHERRMSHAVEIALAHCSALAVIIPGSMDLLPDAWSRDSNVRALFVRSAEIDQLLGRSLELLAFAAALPNAGVEEICALISMTRTEGKVLGWASQGEILHKDAVQRTVSFPTIACLSPA